MYVECSPANCRLRALGKKCENAHFQRKRRVKLAVADAGEKGRGLYAGEDVPAGTFVVEFLGEVRRAAARDCCHAHCPRAR